MVGTKQNTSLSFRCSRGSAAVAEVALSDLFVKVGCTYQEVRLNNHLNRQLTTTTDGTRRILTSDVYIPRMYYAVQEPSEKYILVFAWVDFEGSGYTAVHNAATVTWLHSMLRERTHVQQQDMDGTNEYYSRRFGYLLFDFGDAALYPPDSERSLLGAT